MKIPSLNIGLFRKGQKNNKRRRGTTLVELLVVITILGILTSLLIPVIGDLSSDAQTTSDSNNAANISRRFQEWKAAGGVLTGSGTATDCLSAFLTQEYKASGTATSTTLNGWTFTDTTTRASKVRMMNSGQGTFSSYTTHTMDGNGTVTLTK